MTINEIFELPGAILCSLGGGAVIVTAVAKWCGDLLAQKMLASIKHNYEKEFEQYKAKLQEMSAEFNAILQLSTDVATKQYDMEIDIYKNIWSTLHELSLCQKCIYNFQNPTQADPEEYLLLLKNSRSDFKIKLENFQAQIDSAAPFYQGEAYNLLCELDKKYTELFNIIDSSVSLAGMTSENKERINTQIIPRIEEIKGNLTKIIRDYLFSLKKMPDIPI